MAIGTPVNRGSAQTDTSQSTLPVTTTGAIASGSKIILSAGWRTATTLSSVAGGGLTWTIDRQIVNAGATQHAALITADAPSGLASGTTITLTFSGSTTAKDVSVEEVTGLAAQGSCFDVSATNDQASNSTSFTTGTTATTTAANELLMAVGFFGIVQTGAPTWTNSFTGLTALNSATRSFINGYRIVSATGTYAGTATLATTSTWQSLIGTYKQAAGGASITGAASLTATGTSATVGFASKTGAAAVTGLGSSTTAGVVKRFGTGALTGAGVTSATGVRKVSGSANLTMLGSSLQTGYASRFAQSSLAGAGVLVATAVPNLPITDTFTRTVATGWGTADSGHVWTAQADSGSALTSSVGSGFGQQTILSDGQVRRQYIPIPNTGIGAVFRTAFSAAPGTNVSRVGAHLRLAPPPSGTTSYYNCWLVLSTAGVLQAEMRWVSAGAGGNLGGPTTIVNPYVAGDYYWIRMETVGSLIRMRVWKDGTGEPTAWTFTATDTHVASGVRVALHSSGTGTGSPLGRYDDLSMYPLSAGAVALTGAGTTSATGVVKRSGAAALTKTTSTLSAAGTVTSGAASVTGSASLTGAGTLSTSGVVKRSGSSALVGVGTLAGAGTRKTFASVALTGLGSSLQTGYAKRFAQTSMAMTSQLTATGVRTRTGAASLTGSGTLSATGTRVRTGTASLTATSSLSATGGRGGVATTALSGLGTLTATGVLVSAIRGEAHLVTAGVLSTTGYRTVYGEAHLVTPDPIPPVIIETTGGGGPILRIDLAPIRGEAHLYATGILTASGDRLLSDDEEALRIAVELLL